MNKVVGMRWPKGCMQVTKRSTHAQHGMHMRQCSAVPSSLAWATQLHIVSGNETREGIVKCKNLNERRPPRPGVEFVVGFEQRLPTNDAHKCALAMLIPIFIFERWFGAMLHSHVILHLRESAPEILICGM